MDAPALYVGLVGIGMFVVVRLGIIKSWFILKTLPGLLSGRMMYAMFAFGISFILSHLVASQPNYNGREPNLLILVLLIGPVFGFWFMYHPPRWIKPNWLQWLEQEYGYCLSILIEEAQKMNRWAWEVQVRTRAGMQAWIDDVFIHRREDVEFSWWAEKLYLIEQETDLIMPGMIAEGDIPVHRQDDIAITREEIDAVFAVRNARYRPDEKYMRR
jgi:hypothetical protein